MRRIVMSAVVAFLALSVFALPSDLHALGPYSVTPIDTLGGDQNFANSISNTGYITGNSRKAGGTQLYPYVWQAGMVTEIDVLPDVPTFGRGFDVNDQGVVVGESGNGPSKAFHYDTMTGTLSDLGGLPGGSGGVANGINNAGTVVGAASNGQVVRAFLFDGTPGNPLMDLGTPLGTSDSLGRANGISDSGIVAGNARNDSDTATEPTLWYPDGVGGYVPTTIPSPSPGSFGEAVAVNNAGEAVGRYSDPVSSRTRAFYFDGDDSVQLDLLASQPGYVHSRALDINASGLIVGHVAQFDNAPSFGGAAVAWQDGSIVDLNTLLPAGSGWNLLSAQGVNDLGQIVGFGNLNGETRAFLLSPIPEPSSGAFMLAAVGVLVAVRRRT